MKRTLTVSKILTVLKEKSNHCIRSEITTALDIEDINHLMASKARIALWLLEVLIRCIRHSI